MQIICKNDMEFPELLKKEKPIVEKLYVQGNVTVSYTHLDVYKRQVLQDQKHQFMYIMKVKKIIHKYLPN